MTSIRTVILGFLLCSAPCLAAASSIDSATDETVSFQAIVDDDVVDGLATTREIKASPDVSQGGLVVRQISNDTEVAIDGRLNDSLWRQIEPVSDFYVTDPDTLEEAPLRTDVRIAYNERGLYLSADMEQDPDTLVERLSGRDLGFINRDYFIFNLDTSGEGRYGFWFQLNLGNSRADGTVQPERNFSDSWDGAWYGATARTDNGWVAEYFIPWSLLAMPKVEGTRKMGIYASRKVAYLDERYSWPPLPFTQPKFLSAFQPLIFDHVEPKRQLTFFPYISSSHNRMAGNSERNYGADLFWRPSSNFQLTATALPDFGTVESDQIIVNLTAIETFYPEKRLFFLEGQEIFNPTERSGNSWSSNNTVSQLHTRRIGSRPIRPELPSGFDFDTEEFGRPADVLTAVKGTGQAGRLRYGVLTAFEDDSRFYGRRDEESVLVRQQGRDFGAARFLLESSNGHYKSIGILTTVMSHPTVEAMTTGIDLHYFSKDGSIKIDGQVVSSSVSDETFGVGGFVDMRFNRTRGVSHELVLEQFDDSLNLNHMGYLGRNDFSAIKYRYRRNQFTNGKVKEIYTRISVGGSWNGDDEVIDQGIYLSREYTFSNLTRLRVSTGYSGEEIDDRNSFGNGSYLEPGQLQLEMRYASNNSKRFYYQVSGGWREESFGGRRLSSGVTLLWRPTDRMTINSNVFYSDRDNWLLYRGDRRFTAFETESWSPSLGIQFFVAFNQHLRFDMQWQGIRASQNSFFELQDHTVELLGVSDPDIDAFEEFGISRINMQLRYRWEIAPMSDLFFVYSLAGSLPNAPDESFEDQFLNTFDYPTSKGFIVKLRHHLNT